MNITRATLVETAQRVGSAIVIHAAMVAVSLVLGTRSLAVAVGQMVIAEFGASKMGVRWSTEKSSATPFARAFAGAGLGALAAAVAILLATATRFVDLELASADATSLLVGALTSTVVAIRDELLFRGIVIRTVDSWAPSHRRNHWVVGICVACAIATSVGDGALAIGLASVTAFWFALLWLRDNGAWQAAGAHAAWLFFVGTALRGGFLHLRISDHHLLAFGNPLSFEKSLPVAIGALLVAIGLSGARRVFR